MATREQSANEWIGAAAVLVSGVTASVIAANVEGSLIIILILVLLSLILLIGSHRTIAARGRQEVEQWVFVAELFLMSILFGAAVTALCSAPLLQATRISVSTGAIYTFELGAGAIILFLGCISAARAPRIDRLVAYAVGSFCGLTGYLTVRPGPYEEEVPGYDGSPVTHSHFAPTETLIMWLSVSAVFLFLIWQRRLLLTVPREFLGIRSVVPGEAGSDIERSYSLGKASGCAEAEGVSPEAGARAPDAAPGEARRT
jgi:hypothetical protein